MDEIYTLYLPFSEWYIFKYLKNGSEFSHETITLSLKFSHKHFCAKVCYLKNLCIIHCVKSVHIRSYSGQYFPAFGLNTERYYVSLRIQSKCGKIRTRITPNTDSFYGVVNCYFFNDTRNLKAEFRWGKIILLYYFNFLISIAFYMIFQLQSYKFIGLTWSPQILYISFLMIENKSLKVKMNKSILKKYFWRP